MGAGERPAYIRLSDTGNDVPSHLSILTLFIIVKRPATKFPAYRRVRVYYVHVAWVDRHSFCSCYDSSERCLVGCSNLKNSDL